MRILLLRLRRPGNILSRNAATLINAEFFSKMSDEVFLVTLPGSDPLEGDFNHVMAGKISYKRQEKEELDFLLTRPTFIIDMLTEIKKISPDVIICKGAGYLYSDFLSSLFLSKLIDVPVIGEWMGSDLLLKPSKFRDRIKKILLSNLTLNIVQSDEMLDKALRLSSTAEVKVLPDKGVDTDFFKPCSTDEKTTDTVDILYVGRLHEVKGLKYLLDGFAELIKEHPEIRLKLLGKGNLEEELKDRAQRLGIRDYITFFEEVRYQNVPNYYRRADIFVLPSLSEGLPNVLMEAMASGLPVVATDVGGNKELIQENKGGYLVDPKNSTELSKAIKRLVENPEMRKKMGRFNRDHAIKYDTQNIMKQKRKIISEIVEGSSET